MFKKTYIINILHYDYYIIYTRLKFVRILINMLIKNISQNIYINIY